MSFESVFDNTNPDLYETYSVYDLLCLYWVISQQLDCHRIINLSDFNNLSNDVVKVLKMKWVKTLPPCEYVITKMDLLITCFISNAYENEENYLGFLQKKVPVVMREKKRDERTINNLLFKVHFERKK